MLINMLVHIERQSDYTNMLTFQCTVVENKFAFDLTQTGLFLVLAYKRRYAYVKNYIKQKYQRTRQETTCACSRVIRFTALVH